MFSSNSEGKVVVIGSTTAEQLFGDADPIGKKITLGKEELEVIGTFAKSTASSTFGGEIDSITVVPFDTATAMNNNQAKVYRMYATAKDSADVTAVKAEIEKTLKANHDGEDDFTVLTQDDMLGLFNTFLNLATTMVSAIAAISLVVGGIGIMNIMLVTVTERTREIGLRKAVGATKTAILVQFLIEAVIVTFVGALIGLAIAFIAGIIVAAKTELTPSITPTIILLSVGISVVVGVVFGLWPAIRAAQKDPIEALRYE
jgi:putative ABC transport system permease protein